MNKGAAAIGTILGSLGIAIIGWLFVSVGKASDTANQALSASMVNQSNVADLKADVSVIKSTIFQMALKQGISVPVSTSTKNDPTK